MGGLSIPYATTPMNSRAGMTIGGTRYFMVFPIFRVLAWRHQQVTPECPPRQIKICRRGPQHRAQGSWATSSSAKIDAARPGSLGGGRPAHPLAEGSCSRSAREGDCSIAHPTNHDRSRIETAAAAKERRKQ